MKSVLLVSSCCNLTSFFFCLFFFFLPSSFFFQLLLSQDYGDYGWRRRTGLSMGFRQISLLLTMYLRLLAWWQRLISYTGGHCIVVIEALIFTLLSVLHCTCCSTFNEKKKHRRRKKHQKIDENARICVHLTFLLFKMSPNFSVFSFQVCLANFL